MVLFNVYWLLQAVVAVTLSLTVTAEAISAKSRSIRSKSDYDNFEQMDGRANTNDNNNHHIDAMPAIGTNGGSTQNLDKTPIELLRPCSGWRGSTLLGYAPGSMGSYALAASLTINACLVVYFCSVRVVSMISTRFSERYSVAMTVRNLAEDHPWIIGKVVTEQLFTWILILVSLGFLIATDITEFPFYGSNCTDVISIAFSVNVGRYIWRMLQDAYLREHLKRCWISCLHHLVAVLCYSIMLHYGENLFLGSFGIFMEGNTFCFDILWIFKFCEMSLDNKVYFFFAVMALVFSVCLRFLVPISATVYACVKQSPLSMHPVPLATLFLAGVFFTAINIWVTYSSVSKIRKSYEAKKVAKLQTIVKSKVPDLMKQNILSTGTPLADILSQRNSASGDYTASYYNNINDTNHKIDKTPFNILMQYHDESGSERDADFTNRRGQTLTRSPLPQ